MITHMYFLVLEVGTAVPAENRHKPRQHSLRKCVRSFPPPLGNNAMVFLFQPSPERDIRGVNSTYEIYLKFCSILGFTGKQILARFMLINILKIIIEGVI